jgi:TRAP transporter 4TM/12TM fusion protein
VSGQVAGEKMDEAILETAQDSAEAKKIAKELEDNLAPRRTLAGPVAIVVSTIAVAMTLFQIYATLIDPIDPWFLRAWHLSFAAVLGFLTIPGWRAAKRRIHAVDVAFAVAAVAGTVYIIVEFQTLLYRAGVFPTMPDVIMGTITLILVIELTRRAAGLALPVITLIFISYAFLGPYLPGMLYHRGYDFERTISFIYSLDGIYGVPLAVSSTFVFLFILFGAFLRASGGGQLFIDATTSLFGSVRGGPAKISVVSSSLFGTISGSSVANVVGTGAFTIPLMKSLGYRSHFAGAVESVSSTGGQIMPPVMGAGAFLMAELTGRAYAEIAIAAAIPAFLYYQAAYWMIDFEAVRHGIKGIPRNLLPNFAKVVKERWFLFLPVVMLVYVLIGLQLSPTRAGIAGVIACIVASWFYAANRMGPRRTWAAMDAAARGAIDVAATCASAGIIIGILSLTGLGMKFATVLLGYAGDNLLLALVLTMVVSIVLGMGMPTTAAYAVAASVIAPGLARIGLDLLTAHMFVFYFACLSAITPPVAVASYAAAAIAQSRPMTVAYTSMKLGIAGFIVPYMFVFGPSLLMRGAPHEVFITVVTASVGILFLAAAVQGWLWKNMVIWQRVILFVASLFMIRTGLETDLIGLGLGTLVLVTIKLGIIDRNPALHGN